MPTILIVDDSAADRRLAGGLLSRDGWEVAYAEDGRDAFEQLEGRTEDASTDKVFDAVLTDLQMPHMDGLELTERVNRAFPLVPVILMTSLGSEDIAVRALQAGAASYVPKRNLAKRLRLTAKQILAAAAEDRDHSRLTERLVRQEFVYELTSDLGLVSAAVRAVRALFNGSPFIDDKTKLRLSVAFEEALLNAVYHGNLEVDSELKEADHQAFYDLAEKRSAEPPFSDRVARVHVAISKSEIRVVIDDDGPGFDAASLPDPTSPENLARPHGRGLILIRTFMDEVLHNERGNQITMVKTLGFEPAFVG
ncbi:MAG: response regulator [Planctomycetota bacterium]